MTLDSTLSAVKGKIPGCVFSGYIALDTGIMLAVNPAGRFPPDMLDNLAFAIVNAMTGEHAEQIGAVMGGGGDAAAFCGELMILNDSFEHVFLRPGGKGNIVFCFISEIGAEPGASLAAARANLAELSAAAA
jgi:hypothetical protein